MDIINETIKAINEESDIAQLNINKDEFLTKLDPRIVDEYKVDDDLYNDFGDINMVSTLNNKLAIYIYREKDTNKISVTVGATSSREYLDSVDEVIEFINNEMDQYYKDQEELA